MSADYNIRVSGVPAPAIAEALDRAVTRRLVVDQVGYSDGHCLLERPRGFPSTIVKLSVSGEGWVRLDGGSVHRVPAGSAVLIPAGLPHEYGSGADHWETWWFTVRGSEVADLARSAGFRRDRPLVALRNVARMVALVDEILSSYERDHSPARLLQASGTGWKLLTEIAVDRVLPVRSDPLQRAMDHLAAHSQGDVPVAELAAFVGLSPSRLSALFHASTGGGVHAYLVGLRMAKARRLLDTTAARVGVIAREVGYADPRYFSRHFRRVHGMSPVEFRSRVRP